MYNTKLPTPLKSLSNQSPKTPTKEVLKQTRSCNPQNNIGTDGSSLVSPLVEARNHNQNPVKKKEKHFVEHQVPFGRHNSLA